MIDDWQQQQQQTAKNPTESKIKRKKAVTPKVNCVPVKIPKP